jgi:hypothetical protein
MYIYYLVTPAVSIRPAAAALGYPFFDIYPAVSTKTPIKVVDAHPLGYPYIQLYAAVPPAAFIRRPGVPAAYPFFEIYSEIVKLAAVNVLFKSMSYPHFEIYPAKNDAASISVHLGKAPAYPAFNIYPSAAGRSSDVASMKYSYPFIVICKLNMLVMRILR